MMPAKALMFALWLLAIIAGALVYGCWLFERHIDEQRRRRIAKEQKRAQRAREVAVFNEALVELKRVVEIGERIGMPAVSHAASMLLQQVSKLTH